MTDLPDIDTITTMLTVVEGRNAATTAVSRFDEDHNVLLSTQAEVVELLSRELPPEFDKDSLRNLLDRIDNDIEQNRSARAAAVTRERSGHGA